MKKLVALPSLMIMVLFLCTSCTFHTYHFGVANRAATVPDDFGQTEVAIAHAEQSEGAKYCPDKIAKAKELAHDGAEVYWQCRNTESSRLLAEARQMAQEAEECGPKAAAPAPECNLVVSPASIMKGQSAKLSWSSKNANKCNIRPNIGPVEPQGSKTITPAADTAYTLTCSGEEGKATSDANITVETPPKEELCMALHIEFDTDKAVIKPEYFEEVEKVANFMKRYPQVKGAIEGHTDSVARAGYNLKLSQRRAESVVNMLVEKYGIDESRLSAKGYGLTRPVADNKTKEGRQKNRRIVANFGCVTVEK
jgi:outer membrane protein OmpA-like peptidoglycan-associated protein